ALGMMVEAFRAMGKVTPHDLAVSASLGRVLTGGDADYLDALNEGDLTRLEREEFVQLIQNPATLARMEHMLATGRPLRN
ncbi:MAG: 3-hydroxyacyl-CoA dehydrogenase, partial [Acetobacteraceae bacterium]|nr:3-hydroxyacyl-CoA dehydrogenase [Acetobacteraceae bacterium]